MVAGPGRIVGVHNGDPRSHEPSTSTSHSAYHGLVRAAVQVTSAAALPADTLTLMRHIDIHAQYNNSDVRSIVVRASVKGLTPVTVSIPTSVDTEAHSVLVTADKYGRAAVIGFN